MRKLSAWRRHLIAEERYGSETMVKTTVKIDGMACSMCEAHVQEAIRKAFPEARKVSASHMRKEASFVTDAPVDPEALKAAVNATGYAALDVSSEQAEKKKGLFGLFG